MLCVLLASLVVELMAVFHWVGLHVFVSVVVNYHSWALTINVCSSGTAMASEMPDPWMYPGHDPSTL